MFFHIVPCLFQFDHMNQRVDTKGFEGQVKVQSTNPRDIRLIPGIPDKKWLVIPMTRAETSRQDLFPHVLAIMTTYSPSVPCAVSNFLQSKD